MLYFVTPSQRGDRVGEEFRSRIRVGWAGADPIWVQGGDFAGYSDAVECHRIRPRIAGELGGEVAGEVSPVGGVAGDTHDGEFLPVQKPDLVVVIGADGDQQRVRRRLVHHVGSQKVKVDVERHHPAAPVVGALPRSGQLERPTEVQPDGGAGQLDRGDRRHYLLGDGLAGREAAEGLIQEGDAGDAEVADGTDGLLDRGELRLR